MEVIFIPQLNFSPVTFILIFKLYSYDPPSLTILSFTCSPAATTRLREFLSTVFGQIDSLILREGPKLKSVDKIGRDGITLVNLLW